MGQVAAEPGRSLDPFSLCMTPPKAQAKPAEAAQVEKQDPGGLWGSLAPKSPFLIQPSVWVFRGMVENPTWVLVAVSLAGLGAFMDMWWEVANREVGEVWGEARERAALSC